MNVLHFWNRFTAPPDSIQQPGQRRQAQFVSSAILIIILLAVIVEAATIIVYTGYSDYWATLITLTFLVCTYIL